MNKFVLYWLPVILYALLIFFISSISFTASDIPGPAFYFKDLTLHVVEFFILAVLLLRAFVKEKIRNPYLLTMLITIVYGILDEIHQLFVPGRIFSFADILADSVGSLSVLFFKFFSKK